MPVIEKKMKAAHSKLCFLFLAHKAVSIYSTGVDTSPYSKTRAAMAWALADTIQTFDREGKQRFLSDVAVARVVQHGWLFLRLYQFMAATALVTRRVAFKTRPKLHYFAHLLLDVAATAENPKTQDLFDGEDYIGKIKKVASRCHRRGCYLSLCLRLLLFWSHRWHKRRLGRLV